MVFTNHKTSDLSATVLMNHIGFNHSEIIYFHGDKLHCCDWLFHQYKHICCNSFIITGEAGCGTIFNHKAQDDETRITLMVEFSWYGQFQVMRSELKCNRKMVRLQFWRHSVHSVRKNLVWIHGMHISLQSTRFNIMVMDCCHVQCRIIPEAYRR